MTEPRLVPLSWSHGKLLPDLALSPGSDKPARLTLLHSTDFHSSIDGRDGRGGLARIASTITHTRELGPTLTLDSGDSVFGFGTWWDARGAGTVARLRKMAGYNLAAIGNHDLDHGLHGLREIVAAGYPLLATNIQVADPRVARRLHPAAIVEADGLRIGLLGLITPDTTRLVPAYRMRGITVRPPDKVLAAAVRELSPHVDTIVILSHLGLEGPYSDRWLARTLRGTKVSAILGGHAHEVLDPPLMIDGLLVCNPGPFGANLNRLDVARDAAGSIELRCRVLPQDASVPEEPALTAAIESAREGFRELHQTTFPLPILGSGDDKARERQLLQRALGHFSVFGSGCLLMLPDWYLRQALPPGECVTEADLYNLCPSLERLVQVRITGATLLRLLELQFVSAPATHPVRLSDGRPIRMREVRRDACYALLVPELLAEGQGGGELLRAEALSHRRLPITLLDAVRDYLIDVAASLAEEPLSELIELA